MDKPLIGIIGNILIDQGGMFPGYERAYVNNDYVISVVKAGGIPVILPVISDDNTIKSQVEKVDGIIISGGFDINPLFYGEEPTEKQGFTFNERDEYDMKIVKYSSQLKKPILGICRGIQVINVAFGGTLYQDTSFAKGSYIKHMQNSKPDLPSHTVEIIKDSMLYNIIGESAITNSFHHQSVKDVAPGFKISAMAKDGIIEAIESEKEDFILGVQWHPEMLTARGDTQMLKIFENLILYSKKK